MASWFFVQNRQSLGKTLQQALLWGLIFVGFVAAFGLWENIKDDHAAQISTGDTIVLERQRDGHFYATLLIDGTPIEFLVDTGATDVVLSRSDAERLGIDLDELRFLGVANTANGQVKTARVQLNNLQFEGLETPTLAAYVNDGALDISLLGMGYLRQMDRIEIAGDKMIMQP
ncbi:TIGR02281 family clan AA aspartic protease [Falsihalocynthiibacter sp. SS001]|uniref:retropepsin-like aspartic protease family protein n=1 Tax=Falsihalocynthiibacter sp. SS001 TaxID=3349698 RepID=UPI0036D341DE